jgi:hypothetical protein
MSHTPKLPVSKNTYDEIDARLKAAGYDHAFMDNFKVVDDLPLIDRHQALAIDVGLTSLTAAINDDGHHCPRCGRPCGLVVSDCPVCGAAWPCESPECLRQIAKQALQLALHAGNFAFVNDHTEVCRAQKPVEPKTTEPEQGSCDVSDRHVRSRCDRIRGRQLYAFAIDDIDLEGISNYLPSNKAAEALGKYARELCEAESRRALDALRELRDAVHPNDRTSARLLAAIDAATKLLMKDQLAVDDDTLVVLRDASSGACITRCSWIEFRVSNELTTEEEAAMVMELQLHGIASWGGEVDEGLLEVSVAR